MKTLLITLLSLTLSVSASAQKRGFGGRGVHSRVYVVPSVSFYGGWGLGWGVGYPFGFYDYPFGYLNYPYYGPYAFRSGKSAVLNHEISTIKSNYRLKIKAVRRDKTLDRTQRKQQILALKSERENDIINAQKQFLNNRSDRPAKSGNAKDPDAANAAS